MDTGLEKKTSTDSKRLSKLSGVQVERGEYVLYPPRRRKRGITSNRLTDLQKGIKPFRQGHGLDHAVKGGTRGEFWGENRVNGRKMTHPDIAQSSCK